MKGHQAVMVEQKLQEILEKHRKWLNHEEGGEHADLSNANLFKADLRDADLRGAYLWSANLSCANLSYANLSYANLHNANLCGAHLEGAKLDGADLEGADLRRAGLSPKEMIRKGIVVKRKMTGWKKCQDGVLVKLEIPKGAIVFSINNNKCRTNIAKVTKIEGGNGKTAISRRDGTFIYKLGKTIMVEDFNCQYNVECGEGIHFFRTRKKAENYV